MKKFALLGLVVLAGSLFSGCLIADLAPQQSFTDTEECITTCSAQAGTNSGWVDQAEGTEGPPGYFFPGEFGEYWWSQKMLESASGGGGGCERFPGGGGAVGGQNRIDSYRNDAEQGLAPQGMGGVVGCPTFTLCGWQGPYNGYGACEPTPFTNDVHVSLCNECNGPCDDPALPFFGTTQVAPDPGPCYLADDGGHTFAQYVSFDSAFTATSGGPCGFGDNLAFRPGTLCPDCGAGGPAPTPGDDHKIDVCHIPRGNPDNAHTISIDVAAWPAHEAHGDTQGQCGGGGGVGGLEIDDQFLAPDWVLATCWYVPLPEVRLIDGLPWMDSYVGGVSEYAMERVVDLVNNHPRNETGLAQIGITRITANGSELVLDPPVVLQLHAEIVQGRLATRQAIDPRQDGVAELTEFILANTVTNSGWDLSAWKIETEAGLVLDGATLESALPFKMAWNHDRLARFLDTVQARGGTR